MRIASVESRYGQADREGRVPHLVSLSEEWRSLDEAVASTERMLRSEALTFRTRWLDEERSAVEIEVHDGPTSTVLSLWDAAAIEARSGVPALDFLRAASGLPASPAESTQRGRHDHPSDHIYVRQTRPRQML